MQKFFLPFLEMSSDFTLSVFPIFTSPLLPTYFPFNSCFPPFFFLFSPTVYLFLPSIIPYFSKNVLTNVSRKMHHIACIDHHHQYGVVTKIKYKTISFLITTKIYSSTDATKSMGHSSSTLSVIF